MLLCIVGASVLGACSQQDAGDGTASDAATGGSESGAGGTGGGDNAPMLDVTADAECDLSGKWIYTYRTVTSALNDAVVQKAHNWGFWEVEQEGTTATVVKGLKCGFEVEDHGSQFDTLITVGEPVWNGLTRHMRTDGRQATYGANDGGQCELRAERVYLVRGATVDHFRDPEVPLKDAVTQASEDEPGWEDWDEDGHPGITIRISGLANGELYLVQRDWNIFSGTTTKGADKFETAIEWNSREVVIDKEPDTLPALQSVVSTDPDENFAWFHRVGDDIVGSDDLQTCANVRALKDELIPEANE